MKCKFCKNEIPDGSIFCNYCGERQIKERRQKGDISVPTPRRLPSGRYTIQLRAEGQSVTEDTAEKCIARARAIRAGYIRAEKRPENITLREACERYIDSRKNRLSHTTLEGYEKIINNYFADIMDLPLCELTEKKLDQSVERFAGSVSKRTKRRYSSKTISNAFMLLTPIIREYAPGIDTKKVRLPEKKRKPVQLIAPQDIFAAVRGTEVELPVLLAMWLSLSMSEIRGLTKSKSIRDGRISIVETVVDVRGRPVRKECGKEELRSRTLAIPGYIGRLIDQVDGDIIVPMSAHAITKRFYRLLEKHSLPHIGFHKLRHVNASVMSMLDIPEKEALERGGWKTDAVYKQIYTHTFTHQRQESDRKLDEFFNEIIENSAPQK